MNRVQNAENELMDGFHYIQSSLIRNFECRYMLRYLHNHIPTKTSAVELLSWKSNGSRVIQCISCIGLVFCLY